MSNSVIGLSIDCADAAKLAQFWADILGRQVSPQPTAEFASIDASESRLGLPLAFHQVPEAKTVKNRLHLDLISSDFAAESDRLLSLGATRVTDVERDGARWTTFHDPEGNEFDLVAGMKPPDQDVAAEYVPSSSERARDQVARYEATDGREGGTLEGRPVVILTMTGATSGKIRKTPVMRIERDGTYVAVASAGGAPSHPGWYRNLIANPEVRLQDGAQVHRLRAREVFGEEKAEAWKLAESRWPHFPEYRARAGREIPVLLLEPAAPSEPEPGS